MSFDLEALALEFDKVNISTKYVLSITFEGKNVSITSTGKIIFYDVDEETGSNLSEKMIKKLRDLKVL